MAERSGEQEQEVYHQDRQGHQTWHEAEMAPAGRKLRQPGHHHQQVGELCAMQAEERQRHADREHDDRRVDRRVALTSVPTAESVRVRSTTSAVAPTNTGSAAAGRRRAKTLRAMSR